MTGQVQKGPSLTSAVPRLAPSPAGSLGPSPSPSWHLTGQSPPWHAGETRLHKPRRKGGALAQAPLPPKPFPLPRAQKRRISFPGVREGAAPGPSTPH